MIPEEKREAVIRALSESFGVTECEDIHRLTLGRSPGVHVFRIVVQGRRYLLRVIMRTDDATRHFTCMKAAADAGLAPRVWYTNVADRISITDFVETVPFERTTALRRMASTLRSLHALPPFPRVPDPINTSCMFLINKGPALDAFLEKFRAANLLSGAESEELFTRYAQLEDAYPAHHAEMVSSHNDLFKPDNVLFDGNRVWLVDWECAFLNDRYADLAVVGHLLVTDDAAENAYLQEYFGRPATEYEKARFYFMQQLTHVFYAMGFLWIASLGGPVTQTERTPEWGEFNRQFWSGDIKLEDAQKKTLYGKAHLSRLMHNVRQPRFSEALRIISDRDPGPN